jgi:hypothetical protein
MGLSSFRKVEVGARRVEDGDEERDDAKNDGRKALVGEEGRGAHGGEARDGREDDDRKVNEDALGREADLRASVEPVEAVGALAEGRKIFLKTVIPRCPVKKVTHNEQFNYSPMGSQK